MSPSRTGKNREGVLKEEKIKSDMKEIGKRELSVNMNGLRLNAIRAVNRLIETLNNKTDEDGEIRVYAHEIEEDVEDVRTSIAWMGLVKIDSVEDFDFLDFQTTFFNDPDSPKGYVRGILKEENK